MNCIISPEEWPHILSSGIFWTYQPDDLVTRK